jgi:uncharacterized hydrophobic protein (TIGR00271 family)
VWQLRTSFRSLRQENRSVGAFTLVVIPARLVGYTSASMSTVVTVLFETEILRAAELRWPLRIAALRGEDVVVLVPTTEDGARITHVDLGEGAKGDAPARLLAASLRTVLDQELTATGWVPSQPSSDEEEAASPARDGPLRISLSRVPTEQILREVRSSLEGTAQDMVVSVVDKLPRALNVWRRINRELLREADCQYVFVQPGQRPDGEILFEPSAGQYERSATPLAWRLAQSLGRRATALHVQPEIGLESENAGRKVLNRRLLNALGEEAGQVAQRVEVKDPPEAGILQAAGDDRYEVVIKGIIRPGGDDFNEGRLALRLARATDQPTWIFARAAIPAQTRLQRFLSDQTRRIVPQLQREERTAFVDRVQSSSEWNFDFVALMGLATGIATFGLIGNSPAVIIGAMLVAPLMTPLMGIGLSIIQGNLRLARMTSRTALYGFVLAFGLAFCIGAGNQEFAIATDEMRARHWPNMVDLLVAFVAGVAAAYASGRPGLLAALPGVAIAASLVPPIAASGLALSIGDYDLALGAMLLFLVNVVAIIFASAGALRLVGLQSRRQRSPTARLLSTLITTIMISTTIGVALSPPIAAPPRNLIEAIEAELGEEYRVREVRLKQEEGRKVLQVDLGGSIREHPTFGPTLSAIAKQYLGEKTVVRLSYRHEVLIH